MNFPAQIELTHSMDNDSRQRSIWNPVEDASERINGNEDQNTSEPACHGCADAGLCLDGSTREGSSSSVGTEARTDEVRDANSDELLVGVDLVVVESPKGLCDGDVLEQQNDDRDREVTTEVCEELSAECRLADVLEPLRHVLEEGNWVLLRVVAVLASDPHTGCDGKNDDDKGASEDGDEEASAGQLWVSTRQVDADGANEVEEEECHETESSVDLGVWQAFQGVDDDKIGWLSIGVDVRDAHQLGHLTSSNCESATCHESRHGRRRNELDEPTEAKDTDTQADDTGNEGECCSDDFWCPRVRLGRDLGNDVVCLQRHDGDGTNGDILGGGEEGVDHDTDKGRVETEFRSEASDVGVGHGLWDDDEGDGDASNNIAGQPLGIVGADPLGEGEE